MIALKDVGAAVLCVPPFAVSLPAWALMAAHLPLIAVQVVGSLWSKRLSPGWPN